MAKQLTRSYLETLSFPQLCDLADEYDVDVPENLDRRFLIEELLELSNEQIKKESETESDFDEIVLLSSKNEDDEFSEIAPLQKNYNETQISCVLRNPAWLFVFWNLNVDERKKIELSGQPLMINVHCDVTGSFEVKASDSEDQEQYILIPDGNTSVKVELVCKGLLQSSLAFSEEILIPEGSSLLNDFHPGKEVEFTEILLLSGMKNLMYTQYKNHRNSL